MPRPIRKLSTTAGLVPGTLVHVGEKKSEKCRISIMDYNQDQFQEKEVDSIEDCFHFRDTSTVTWINIDGIHDTGMIEKLGAHFNLHPLILEDIVNTSQRPKIEDYERYIFAVIKMLYHGGRKNDIVIEQVSFILGPNYVISFQEKEGDVFNAVRDRIRYAKGRVRKFGPDYLMYSLMDAIVDNYFVILEAIGEDLEKVEEVITKNPTPRVLNVIHRMKRDAVVLRKAIWPLREVISGLARGESGLILDATRIYFRDVYDHTIQVMDTLEASRDMVSGMLDIYLSGMSNRMNEVMKVLTIFAAIFIPLTFIAGVYGMNFEYMPELKWHGGYFAVLGLMGSVAAVMLAYFKRKKWF